MGHPSGQAAPAAARYQSRAAPTIDVVPRPAPFRLTLIAAPAGFGKTTLLAEWAAGQSTPTAWLTVDAADRDLPRFVEYVVAAIETVAPGVGDPMLALLQRPHPVPAAEVGASLADELLDLDHDVVLVVDDFHLADSADVELFLGGLLPLLPPAFHLVLVTRTDPTLPLARLRLQGSVNEVRAAELRFNETETRALLALAGLPDADAVFIATLLDQTEGWVALLCLASLAVPVITEPARLAEAVTHNQHLMNFLTEEVLNQESAEVQDFLLRTAIVDRICAPLADALLERTPPEGSWEPPGAAGTRELPARADWRRAGLVSLPSAVSEPAAPPARSSARAI